MKILLVVVLLSIQQPGIHITVIPRVVMTGGSIQMTCRIPRHESNRILQWGFTNWVESERQLEGEKAPAIFQMTLQRVPCYPGEAFCRVVTTNNSAQTATNIEVTGCNP